MYGWDIFEVMDHPIPMGRPELESIVEEVNLLDPWCSRCNTMSPWRVSNKRHLATAQCARGEERKRRWLAEEELRESLERAFQAYGEPLEIVTAFRYLGRVMMAGDDE